MSKQRTLLSYESLVHAIAGGCGSAVAMTAFYPLDTVRTRLQLDDEKRSQNIFSYMWEIYQREGLPGLYKGLKSVTQSLYCSNFVYFYTFHGLKEAANKDKSAFKDLILGMIAGCINVLTTTPLWVVNTRIKMQGTKANNKQMSLTPKYKSLFDGLCRISQEEGVATLWSGTLPSLILVINPAIQFMTYEAIKKRIQISTGTNELHSLAAFLAGATAKAVATILTYPLQLVQAKQRHGHNYADLPQKAGIIQMALYIVRLQGARGLYKGLEAKILQTVLTAALMFVLYEKIANLVFTIMLRNKK